MNIHQARTRYNTLWNQFCNSTLPGDAISKEMFTLEKEFGLKALTPKIKETQLKPKNPRIAKRKNLKWYNYKGTYGDNLQTVTREREEKENQWCSENYEYINNK